MVVDADGGDLAVDQNSGHPDSAGSNNAEEELSHTDRNVSDHFDADSYATMIYRANLESGAADAQNEYNATPELQSLLAQASAAPTVRRRRPRRM
ncbi:hypothetical protein [Mycolicibacterium sp. F2034L]|uniref:hypothetical protein n=1 Tax=Mycolicibacterium sp. F2034L TaxID=2926422 RepID=UPI001FF3BDCD|nr:hypothetical protein [Mycolicibacterium sp. F2034L]MCK0175903.1 hypothetical protein [Mycolicibacterium sp. F2034L]